MLVRPGLVAVCILISCNVPPAPPHRVVEPNTQATVAAASEVSFAEERAARPKLRPGFEPAVATGTNECTDGKDNDGDGFVDWVYDTGCYGPADSSEAAHPRSQEDGFSTFEIGPDSRVVYVAATGSDAADGRSPRSAVQSIVRAAQLVRDGHHDFILLRRGDSWRDQRLGRFKSGRDAQHPLVIGSYGASTQRPIISLDGFFINHEGKPRSFVALIDLDLRLYTQDPKDPSFTGATSGLLSYIGGGSHLLIEGCRLRSGELVIGGPRSPYEAVEIRRNLIDQVYHVGTCKAGDLNGDNRYRPSGIYSKHIERLLIEENTFDHNGWSEEVPGACATIYNHNVYLNANDLVVRGNNFFRASSIHIKLRSDEPGEMSRALVEDNYFVEGEVGISIGGNGREPGRFIDSTIRRNVFSRIGSSRPTGRRLAWGIWVTGVDGLLIQDNLFLKQDAPSVDNAYGVELSDNAVNVEIAHNFFYRVQTAAISIQRKGERKNITVRDNTIMGDGVSGVAVRHLDSFEHYKYQGNRYVIAPGTAAFRGPTGRPVDYDSWTKLSGEVGGQAVERHLLPDRTRDIESYAQLQGSAPTIEGYVEAWAQIGRLQWRPLLLAKEINAYVREGFGFNLLQGERVSP